MFTRADLWSCRVALAIRFFMAIQKVAFALKNALAIESLTPETIGKNFCRSISAARGGSGVSSDYAVTCVEWLVLFRASLVLHDSLCLAEDASSEGHTAVNRGAYTNYFKTLCTDMKNAGLVDHRVAIRKRKSQWCPSCERAFFVCPK